MAISPTANPSSPTSGLIPQAAKVTSAMSADTVRTYMAMGRKLDHTNPGVVRQTAANMVSELFFKPVLAEMRKFPFGRELATGGYTESVFGEQLDERVADIVAGSDTGVVRQIVTQLQPPPPQPGTDRSTWQTELQVTGKALARGDS